MSVTREFFGKKLVYDLLRYEPNANALALEELVLAFCSTESQNERRFPFGYEKELKKKLTSDSILFKEEYERRVDFVTNYAFPERGKRKNVTEDDFKVGPKHENENEDEDEDEDEESPPKKRRLEKIEAGEKKNAKRNLEELLSAVPDELWIGIFSELPDFYDLAAVGKTTTAWAKITKNWIARRYPGSSRISNDYMKSFSGADVKKLDLSYDDEIGHEALLSLSASLEELDVFGNNEINHPDLTGLTNLRSLKAGQVSDDGKQAWISGLTNLTRLDILAEDLYEVFVESEKKPLRFPKLKYLSVHSEGYDQTYSMGTTKLGNLHELETLKERGKIVFHFLEGETAGDALPSLTKLSTGRTHWLEEDKLRTLTRLTSLKLDPPIDLAGYISHEHSLDLSLQTLTNLTKLNLNTPGDDERLDGSLSANTFAFLVNLKTLEISGRGAHLQNALPYLTNLTHLNASKSKNLFQQSFLPLSHSLVALNLSGSFGLKDVNFLQRFSSLTSLDVTDMHDLDEKNDLLSTNASFTRRVKTLKLTAGSLDFRKFPNLTELHLQGKNERAKATFGLDFSPFVFPALNYLSLKTQKDRFTTKKVNGMLKNVIPSLTTFKGWSLGGLENETLSRMSNLTDLEILECRNITDVGSLGKLTKLKKLHWSCSTYTKVESYLGLKSLLDLQYVRIHGKNPESTKLKRQRMRLIDFLINLDGLSKKELMNIGEDEW